MTETSAPLRRQSRGREAAKEPNVSQMQGDDIPSPLVACLVTLRPPVLIRIICELWPLLAGLSHGTMMRSHRELGSPTFAERTFLMEINARLP